MADAAIRSRYSSKASRPASSPAASARRARTPPSPLPEAESRSSQAPRRGLPVGGRVGQAGLLLAQQVVLVGVRELGGGDLGHLVAQDVGLAGPRLDVAPEGGQRRRDVAQPGPQREHRPPYRCRRRRRARRVAPPG